MKCYECSEEILYRKEEKFYIRKKRNSISERKKFYIRKKRNNSENEMSER